MSTAGGGSPRHEQSFADVLNGLSQGPRRPPRKPEPEGEQRFEQQPEEQDEWELGSWAAHRAGETSARHAERPSHRRFEEPADQTWDVSWLSPAAPSDPDADLGTAEARWAAVAEEWGEPQDFGSVVRPYSWTKGRTRPVYDLEVETLVSTTEHGRDNAGLNSVEHRAIAELCRTPRSVAEVGALLSLPLGVARVLLGDMADIGLVMVHRTATGSGERPDLAFMERVLSGLRRL